MFGKVNDIEEKLYYRAGDCVILRHREIQNRVPMYIVEKVTRQFKKDDSVENFFCGFKCRWFDKNNVLQEAVFSTKDLELYHK